MIRPARILIADDQSTIITVMSRRLQAAGYDVICAKDGEEVLTKLGQGLPDLFILDVCMPKRNGYSVCESLRDNPLTKHIPIILCTGTGSEADHLMDRAIELGAVSWIYKPFTHQELLDKVRMVFHPPS